MNWTLKLAGEASKLVADPTNFDRQYAGLGEPFFRAVQGAQVVLQVGRIGGQRGGALVGRRGGSHVTARHVDVAQVVEKTGEARHQARGLLDQRDALFAVAALVPNHAQEMQCVGVLWRGGEDAAVERFRALELAALMHLDGQAQRIGQVQFGGCGRRAGRIGATHLVSRSGSCKRL